MPDTATYSKMVESLESCDYDKILPRVTLEVFRLLHAGMGLSTEVGEFTDALKKHLIYGADLDKTNLIEELGDILWYITLAANVLGVSLKDIKAANENKLKARYKDRFTEDEAVNRDLEAERSKLEIRTTDG